MERINFDLGTNTEHTRFEKLTSNHEWVNSTVRWYTENLKDTQKMGVRNYDLGGWPIAEGNNFPNKLTQFYSRINEPTPEVAKAVVDKILQDPALVVNLPSIYYPNPFENRLFTNSEWYEVHSQMIEKMAPTRGNSEMIKNERSSLENVDKAKELETVLGLTEFKLSYEQIATISKQVAEVKSSLNKALYLRFVLERAVETIKEIAPILTNEVDDILGGLVIVKSEPGVIGKGGFGFVKVGEKNIFLFDQSIDDYFDKEHVYRVLAAGHELMHGVVVKMLDLPGAGFGEQPTDKVILDKRFRASLAGTILEAASISYEYELTNRALSFTSDKSPISRLQEFNKKRGEHAKRKNRFLSKQSTFDTSWDSGFSYPEGIKLAISMRRNGFTLDDLGEIVQHIKISTSRHMGRPYEPEMLYQIGIKRSIDSTYQKIVTELRKQKK